MRGETKAERIGSTVGLFDDIYQKVKYYRPDDVTAEEGEFLDLVAENLLKTRSQVLSLLSVWKGEQIDGALFGAPPEMRDEAEEDVTVDDAPPTEDTVKIGVSEPAPEGWVKAYAMPTGMVFAGKHLALINPAHGEKPRVSIRSEGEEFDAIALQNGTPSRDIMVIIPEFLAMVYGIPTIADDTEAGVADILGDVGGE